MLTKKHKEQFKKLLMDRCGIKARMFKEASPGRFNVFLENANPNSCLTLALEDVIGSAFTQCKRFNLYASGYTLDLSGNLYSILNKGMYNKILNLNTNFKTDRFVIDHRVINVEIGTGFLNNIENASPLTLTYSLNYRNILTQKLSDEVIYLVETNDTVAIKLLNENFSLLHKKESTLVYNMHTDKEAILKRLASAYIDYLHNKNVWNVSLPNLTSDDFLNMDTVDEIISSYKDELALSNMITV